MKRRFNLGCLSEDKFMSVVGSLVLILLFGFSETLVHGEMRFRSFNDDRARFEVYVSRAGEELSREEWQSIMDRAGEEMIADWEKTAELEAMRFLDQGYSKDSIDEARKRALEDWKRDFGDETFIEKGKWLIFREHLTFEAEDFGDLRSKIKELESDDSVGSGEEWDSLLHDTLEKVNGNFEVRLLAFVDLLKEKGAALSGKEKEGFEQEIERLEKKYSEQFSLERDGFLFLGRNKFIEEHFGDHSLRAQSELEDGKTVSREIIAGVNEELEGTEDRILSRSYDDSGVGGIDFSNMGEDWQEEVKQLLQYGMDRWKQAGEELYGEMARWQSGSNEAYENARKKWREAFEDLESAGKTWQEKIEDEIMQGLENWKNQDASLSENIEEARSDFENYLNNLEGGWSEHTQGLVGMALEASKLYGQAIDNVKWLEEKANEYRDRGFFGDRDVEIKLKESDALDDSDDSDTDKFSVFLKSYNGGQYKEQFENAMAKLVDRVSKYSDVLEYFCRYKFLGFEERKDDDGSTYIVESYEVKFYTLEEYEEEGEEEPEYEEEEVPHNSLSFTVENVVRGESAYKSQNYYYLSELRRWESILDSFKDIAFNAEQEIHRGNMLGYDVGAGDIPGYLVNAGDSHSPYLMTTAEYNLRLAQQERDFWANRLEIAKAVRDYSTGSERESAEETLANKEEAEKRMERAKSDYETALGQVRELVDKMSEIREGRGNAGEAGYLPGIEKLTEEYLELEKELEESHENLQAARQSLILFKNGENPSYLKKNIMEIQNNLIDARKNLRAKELEYYSSLGEREYARESAEFAAMYQELALAKEQSKDRHELLSSIVFGEENHDSLKAWAESLCLKKDELWGEDGDSQAGILQGMVDEIGEREKESGDENAAYLEILYGELSRFISDTCFEFRADYEVAKYLLNKVRDENFDRDEFMDKSFDIDPGEYLAAAEVSRDALEILKTAFEESEKDDKKSYDSIVEYIRDNMPKKKYGEENLENLRYETALFIMAEKFQGLTPENFGSYRNKLDDESVKSEKICEFYSEESGEYYYGNLTPDFPSQLSGSEEEELLGKEFENPGINIAGFEYIYNNTDDMRLREIKHGSLWDYIENNPTLLLSEQKKLSHEGGLLELFKHINSSLKLKNGEIESLGDFMDCLHDCKPAQLVKVAESLEGYINEKYAQGENVPAYIEDISTEIAGLAFNIERDLYIRNYIRSDEQFDVDEKIEELRGLVNGFSGIENFLFTAEELILSGTPITLDVASGFLDLFDGKVPDSENNLGEAERNLLENHEDESVAKVVKFVEDLRAFVAENKKDEGDAGIGEGENSENSDEEKFFEPGDIPFQGALEVLARERDSHSRELSKVEALRSFLNGGDSGDSWRDYALEIDPDEFKKEVKEDSDGIGEPSQDSEAGEGETPPETVDEKPLFQIVGGTFDSYGEDGKLITLAVSDAGYKLGGRVLSHNRILDSMNELYGIFELLVEVSKKEVSREIKNASENFLEKADKVYDSSRDYDLGDNEKYSFEGKLQDLVSGLESKSSYLEEISAGFRQEVNVIREGISSMEFSLGDKRKSYDLLKSSTQTGSLETYDKQRKEHEAVKRAYEEKRNELEKAQELYDEANGKYLNKMKEVAECYNSYVNLEFEYDKAYSIWEYAHTPYLEKNSDTDPGLSQGQGVDGDVQDYGELNVPDAEDNYNRINAKYKEVLKNYEEKKEARENSETRGKLNEDKDYGAAKEEFIQEAESFIRASQVSAKIEEDLEEQKRNYDAALERYENARESISFFNDIEEGDRSDLRQDFYLILSHITNSTELKQYKTGIKLYEAKIQFDKNKDNWIFHYPNGTIGYTDRYEYTRGYAAQFNALPKKIKDDIATLYNKFEPKAKGKSLSKIKNNYYEYIYWYDMYKYANKRYHSYSSWRKVSRRRWKGKRNSRESKYRKARGQCKNAYENLEKTLDDFFNAREALEKEKAAYEDFAFVRYIDKTSYNKATIKSYLQDPRYGLTKEDLSLIYDNFTAGTVTDDTMNISSLRMESHRVDLNGDAVLARYSGGTIYILNKDGKTTGEKYEWGDTSIALELGGKRIEEPKEGQDYQIIDRTYDIEKVANLLQKKYKEMHNDSRMKLLNYVQTSANEKKHDYTVMLHDLDLNYIKLKDYAVNFKRKESGKNKEIRQRRFEGYETILKEMVNNDDGDGISIHGLIMKEYVRQHRAFQEQKWAHQQEKFNLRKNRWKEVVGFILNRGSREWRLAQNDFISQWNAWDMKAKEQIEEGIAWWDEKTKSFEEDYVKWQEETAQSASREALKKIFENLEERISKYASDANERAPGIFEFNINTGDIVNDAKDRISVNSIGVLTNSHTSADTMAGITEIMNLGLSNALFERHESMMEEYGNAMAIMQNLQVIDILNGIIEGFNNQLEAANENVYDSIESDIASYVSDEDGVAFAEAPFERNKANHTWSIRVCVASNLTGDKHKTRTFQDYSNYINKSVFLKPLEGLKGSKIDFTKPDSYANLDADELQVYVDLESELLNRRIDEVFEKNGLFEEHTEKEFDRLQKDFSKYYGQWVAGEAMKSAGFYAKPMFPGGPSMMQTAVIAASLSGNPWIALAVNAVSTGIQVADGTMSLKQAGFQIAMSAAGSAIGVGADSLGNFVGGAVGSSVVGAVVKSTTMVTGNTLLSGMTYSDEGGFNWQGSRMKNWKTWAGAGITAGAGALVAGFDLKGITGAGLNTLGSGTSQGIVTGDWKESFQTAAINGAAGYLTGKLKFQSEVMQNASNMAFRNLFGSGEGFNWAVVAQTDPMGNFFTDLFSGKVVSPWTEQALNEQNAARKQHQEDAMATLGFLDRLEMGLGGVFLSMKEGLGNAMNGLVTGVAQDLKGFAGDMSALGAGIGSVVDLIQDIGTDIITGIGSLFTKKNIVTIIEDNPDDSYTREGLGGEEDEREITEKDREWLSKSFNLNDLTEEEMRDILNLRDKGRNTGKELNKPVSNRIDDKKNSGKWGYLKTKFMKHFGNDAEKLRAISYERGDGWNEKGVNIIGLRNDTVASGRDKNKHDDIFVVVVDGKIKGVFAGSTDPGAPKPGNKPNKNGTAHLPEGEYDFGFVPHEKAKEWSSSADKHNDVFVPKDNLDVYRDTSGNGFIDGDEMDKKWSSWKNIWFHAGDDTNKPVNGYSLGCQIIALDRYWDSEKGYLSTNDKQTTYSSKSKQWAYNAFLNKVNGRDFKYHLFNKKRSKYHQRLYNKYRGLLKF